MNSGKLAEISLAKAYSLNLDFCELAEIRKNCAIALQGTNNIVLVIDIIIGITRLKIIAAWGSCTLDGWGNV